MILKKSAGVTGTFFVSMVDSDLFVLFIYGICGVAPF